ncbi:MAG: sulfite exporter TauE/SafE family protein [Fimbriimonadaceae bacterium]
MPDPVTLLAIAAVGVVAGAVAGVVGFGSAVLLLPVCNAAFGPLPSVGMLTVAALIGNLSRVALWYRDIDWKVVWRYLAAGIPSAILGSLVLVRFDTKLLPLVFGVFVVSLIPIRRWMDKTERSMKLGQFPVLGAVMGFLSAVVSTTGPINAPFFVSYGLTQGAYLSTEALGTAGIHLAKSLAYGKLQTLDAEGLIVGVALGGCLLVGTAISKPLVTRLNKETFVVVVEVLLAASGVLMVAQALLSLN